VEAAPAAVAEAARRRGCASTCNRPYSAPPGTLLGEPATVATRLELRSGPHELPRRQRRAFRAMAEPVVRAHLTAALAQPVSGRVDPPTDAAGARRHATPAGGATAGSWPCD
jgi:hypothetical protein